MLLVDAAFLVPLFLFLFLLLLLLLASWITQFFMGLLVDEKIPWPWVTTVEDWMMDGWM